MKKIIGLIIISIFLINACGPTLESSQKSWDSNLKAVNQLKSQYPVFSELIDQKLAEAKKVWDEAQGISDEEAKLDKMVEANRILSGGVIGNLRDMKDKIASLKSESNDLLSLQTNDSTLLHKADMARNNAKLAVQKAEAILTMSAAEFDMNTIQSKIDLAYTGLKDAEAELNTVADLINDSNQKIEDEKRKKEEELKAQKEKEEKAKADIECEYCGTMNKYDRTNCKKCGAPLPKNK